MPDAEILAADTPSPDSSFRQESDSVASSPPGGNNRRSRAPSPRDAGRLLQILQRRARAPPAPCRNASAARACGRADAGDVVERVGDEGSWPASGGARRSRSGGPRRAAAGGRRARGELSGSVISRPPGRWNISRPALRSGPLEIADHRHVVDAQLLHHLAAPRRAGPCRRRSAADRAIRRGVRSGSSFSSRAKRRPSTSRIIAKSSPGAVSGRLMLNLR